MRLTHFHKVVAILTCLFFGFSQFASPQTQISAYPRKPSVTSLIDDLPSRYSKLHSLNLPRSFEEKKPGTFPLVILLEEAHGESLAQENLEKTLCHLEKRFRALGLSTAFPIFLEGNAAGKEIDPFLLRLFPDKDIVRELTQVLVAQGHLDGAERYAILENHKVILKGLENETDYEKNLSSACAFLVDQPKVLGRLEALRNRIESLKAKFYGRALAVLEKSRKRLEGESGYFFQHLLLLQSLAKEKRIHLKSFPHLNSILKIIQGSVKPPLQSISPYFYEELESLESQIKSVLSRRSEEEEILFKADTNLALMERLAKLSLGSRQAGELLSDWTGIISDPVWKYGKFDDGFLSDLKQATQLLEPALEFYRAAKARDQILAHHLISEIKRGKQKIVFAVVGGFHQKAIVDQLKKNGIASMVLTPRLGRVNSGNSYWKMLSQDSNVQILPSYLKLRSQIGNPNFSSALIRSLVARARAQYGSRADAILGQYRLNLAQAGNPVEVRSALEFLDACSLGKSDDLDEDEELAVRHLVDLIRAAQEGKAPKAMKELFTIQFLNDSFQKMGLSLRVEKELGEGGGGTVFKGTYTKKGKTHEVAVKVVFTDFFSGDAERNIRRFYREARIMRSIAHPGVVRAHHVGALADGKVLFYVMDYVEGEDLAKYLDLGDKKRRRLKIEEAVELTIKILDALAHVHEKGIIHRDLKPLNILLTVNDKNKLFPVITDFGLAKVEEQSPLHSGKGRLTPKETTLGTTAYLSPEQTLDARDVDARTDLYVVATMFYQMLTGKLPIPDEITQLDAMAAPQLVAAILLPGVPTQMRLGAMRTLYKVKIRELTPPPPSILNRRIPDSLDAIILKGLSKKPSDRYPTAKAFKEALETFLEGYRILAPQGSHLKEASDTKIGDDPDPEAARIQREELERGIFDIAKNRAARLPRKPQGPRIRDFLRGVSLNNISENPAGCLAGCLALVLGLVVVMAIWNGQKTKWEDRQKAEEALKTRQTEIEARISEEVEKSRLQSKEEVARKMIILLKAQVAVRDRDISAAVEHFDTFLRDPVADEKAIEQFSAALNDLNVAMTMSNVSQAEVLGYVELLKSLQRHFYWQQLTAPIRARTLFAFALTVQSSLPSQDSRAYFLAAAQQFDWSVNTVSMHKDKLILLQEKARCEIYAFDFDAFIRTWQSIRRLPSMGPADLRPVRKLVLDALIDSAKRLLLEKDEVRFRQVKTAFKIVEIDPNDPDHARAQKILDELKAASARSLGSASGGGNSPAEIAAMQAMVAAFHKQWGARYLINGLLGKGGMGAVFKGVERQTGINIAVKMIFATSAFLKEDHDRLKREARVLARISDHGIVRLLGAGQFKDHQGISRIFIVEEMVPGKSLHQTRAYWFGRPIEERVQLICQVARSLAVVHEAGFFHRDLKPANIVIRDDGGELSPVIIDFGLAGIQEGVTLEQTTQTSLTQNGVMLGTPLYMSPQQILANKDEIDYRTDIYALGVILYELLRGTPPFDGSQGSVMALGQKILLETPPSIREVNPEVPETLEKIVTKAMAKKLEERYQTALAFAEDLDQFLKSRQAGTVPDRAVPSTRQVSTHVLSQAKMGRGILALALSIPLLAVLTGITLWIKSRPSRSSSVQITGPEPKTIPNGNLKSSKNIFEAFDDLIGKVQYEKAELEFKKITAGRAGMSPEEEIGFQLREKFLAAHSGYLKLLNEKSGPSFKLVSEKIRTDFERIKDLLPPALKYLAYYYIAKCLEAENRFEEAQQAHRETFKLALTDRTRMIELKQQAYLLSRLGRFAEANKVLDEIKALEKQPDYPEEDIFLTQMENLLFLGEYQKVQADLKKWLSGIPADRMVWVKGNAVLYLSLVLELAKVRLLDKNTDDKAVRLIADSRETQILAESQAMPKSYHAVLVRASTEVSKWDEQKGKAAKDKIMLAARHLLSCCFMWEHAMSQISREKSREEKIAEANRYLKQILEMEQNASGSLKAELTPPAAFSRILLQGFRPGEEAELISQEESSSAKTSEFAFKLLAAGLRIRREVFGGKLEAGLPERGELERYKKLFRRAVPLLRNTGYFDLANFASILIREYETRGQSLGREEGVQAPIFLEFDMRYFREIRKMKKMKAIIFLISDAKLKRRLEIRHPALWKEEKIGFLLWKRGPVSQMKFLDAEELLAQSQFLTGVTQNVRGLVLAPQFEQVWKHPDLERVTFDSIRFQNDSRYRMAYLELIFDWESQRSFHQAFRFDLGTQVWQPVREVFETLLRKASEARIIKLAA